MGRLFRDESLLAMVADYSLVDAVGAPPWASLKILNFTLPRMPLAEGPERVKMAAMPVVVVPSLRPQGEAEAAPALT